MAGWRGCDRGQLSCDGRARRGYRIRFCGVRAVSSSRVSLADEQGCPKPRTVRIQRRSSLLAGSGTYPPASGAMLDLKQARWPMPADASTQRLRGESVFTAAEWHTHAARSQV